MSDATTTPFDEAIRQIREAGYHNHRRENHSNAVSIGILHDLVKSCDAFRDDFEANRIGQWRNWHTPGARGRKIDLLVAEPIHGQEEPDLTRMRLCVENKSVVTAHRNADARYDDLNEALQVLYRVQPDAIFVATVLVGLSEKVLNVPDRAKSLFPGGKREFERRILPRLSKGDRALWDEFPNAVSRNRPSDARKTVEKFRLLPLREPGRTHVVGYDFVLLVPVRIDNVNPPEIARQNRLGIDIDKDYARMLGKICRAYETRWR